MQRSLYTLLPGFLLLVFTSSLRAQSLTGRWQGRLSDWYVIVLNLKAEGNKLSGMAYTVSEDKPITDGKITGNEFSFAIPFSGGYTTTYKGKIEGDKLSLSMPTSNGIINGELNRVAANLPTPIPMKPSMTEFYTPVPPVVNTGASPAVAPPPSDAKILFDGKDLSQWKGRDGEAKWTVHDGVFTVKKGTGDIETKDSFGDYQLHIEWQIPKDITGEGQARGNSGIFMQNIYELQVLDNYENKTYTNGQAGSIYKQQAPLANAMRPPGEWNVYDIIYTAPRFDDKGAMLYPAYITVIHNGVLVQNHYAIRGDTPYTGLPQYKKHGKGPLRLQDHGDPSEPISFRNIWIREL